MHAILATLQMVKHSDNLGSIGWTSVWARGWTRESVEFVMDLCPRGNFTVTTYIDTDARNKWTYEQQQQALRYGNPFHVMFNGAYFSVPMDMGCVHLFQALDWLDELMLGLADQWRHKWPKQGGSLHVAIP